MTASPPAWSRKILHALQARHGDDVAIVFVHGFGAGSFAWRHILQPVADAAGCKVLAFDRPAFGKPFC